MVFLYDNLVATIVSMTVLLVLVSIQMRATQASFSQTARLTSLNQAKTLSTWLEQDLEEMGRNMNQTPFTTPSKQTESASPTNEITTQFEFEYQDNAGTNTTTYYISEVGTQTINGNDRTLYQLERTDGTNQTGESPATLGYLDIQFLDKNAGEILDPEANEGKIEAIRVHFSVISHFQNEQTIVKEAHRMVVVPYLPAHE